MSVCKYQGGAVVTRGASVMSREIHLSSCLRGRPQVGSKEIAAVGKGKGK